MCTQTEKDNYNYNFKKRIDILKITLQIWKQRKLSLKGKVTVLNSLALAPLTYISSVVDTPKRAITEIQSLIMNFFWDGKSPKVAKNVLTQHIDKGGLKLCNFEIKTEALRLAWVNRIIENKNSRWTAVLKFYLKCKDLEFYLSCKHKIIHDRMPTFYKVMLNAWAHLYNVEPSGVEQIQNEIIWNNQFMICNKQTLFWEDWISAGIIKIKHLLNSDGHFLSHNEIIEKYNVRCSFLNILQLRHIIPKPWMNKLKECKKICPDSRQPSINISGMYKSIEKLKCKDFYWALVDRTKVEPKCVHKWSEIYPYFETAEPEIWKRIFNMAFNVTQETLIQSFQYRLIHRIIPCNKWLETIRVKDTNICNYCDNVDDLQHFFLYCHNVHKFWVSLYKWWNRTSGIIINNETEIEECILFGYPGEEDIVKVLNYVIIQAKYYIYIQRLCAENNIDFYDFLMILQQKLRIKKYNCEYRNNPGSFEPYLVIFEAL